MLETSGPQAEVVFTFVLPPAPEHDEDLEVDVRVERRCIVDAAVLTVALSEGSCDGEIEIEVAKSGTAGVGKASNSAFNWAS